GPHRRRRRSVPDAGRDEPIPENGRDYVPPRCRYEPAAHQQARLPSGPGTEVLWRILLRNRGRSAGVVSRLSRNVDQSALPFRDRLAVLDKAFPPQVNGSGEARFHSLERCPATFVLDAFRRDQFDLPRVHDNEVRIAAHLDRSLRNPQDLGGPSRHRGTEPREVQFAGPATP